ncbi:DNA replication terminus site-binding protein [Providencia hangzhouensis]|uniref:DNA replication terminus site-binding protein n=1 Tax=Providencia rettgeri TaxID=587 RepID=A0AAJ4TGU0_PRORE|nr:MULTISPECIES: DNA replication terminus site-binding protein [Providencia]MBJ9973408.1 DNA replication terminus site-binding protein [Providencia rettgeri]MCF8961444.1 DNA replication terminus site-binding protein [Providencia rettgeri]QWQ15110.1 DNA replication terminus site-binding protein [Providencia rettgeri]QWQ18942.1 DNA replication terminus site-binding protein [Providencia rettgeri]QWQ22777.1 DNA replication terminus site-binding protein [Providencia rettgeri]
MKKQDLINTFNELESQINQFSLLLLEQSKQVPFTAHVFQLPSVIKGEENNEIEQISVQTLIGHDAIRETVKLVNLLFLQNKPDEVSNKAAIRLPGVICVQTNLQTYRNFNSLILKINELKMHIKAIVTQVDEPHRFEFIRDSLHGLLTLNTYRTLSSLIDVDTINFGWANKKVINKVTKEAMLDRLQASLESGRCPLHLPKEHWRLQLENEIRLIDALPYNAVLKTQRPVKVQPIARVWDKEQQKQTQFACATPLFVFALEKTVAEIKVGELLDYHANNIAIRNRPRAKAVELLIPRLNLYIER